MGDVQPYTLSDHIVAAIGLISGSTLLISIIFFVLIGLNKITLKKRLNCFAFTGIATIIAMLLGIIIGKPSIKLFFSQLIGGWLFGFISEKIVARNRNK